VLGHLRIRGLALLDDVSLDFQPGMNVLTGETGAGKSIIVDALGLLRGARGRAELIRDGESNARVEAQFVLEDAAQRRLVSRLAEREVELEDGALIISRRIGRQGARSIIQDSMTTLKALGEVGSELIEICSQHEHHSLTQVAHHLDLLDAHADLLADREAHREAHTRWRESLQALEASRAQALAGHARADYLRFQIEELERVAPVPGEFDELRQRLLILRDAARLGGFARDAHDALYEADDAIAGRISTLLEQARRGPESAGSLGEIAEQLETAQIACEEAAAAASRLSKELLFEPYELERAEERVHELEQLRRKHGCSADELSTLVVEMRSDLEAIENVEDQIQQLEEVVSDRRERCLDLAQSLSKKRRAAAQGLGEAVAGELRALHIPEARLRVRFDAPLKDPGPHGIDRVELEFSANAGEPLAPLTKVASGGELSRVLLAIKSVLSEGEGERVATYVFDEVDAGVGGAVAEAIGERLHRASRDRQVLCITHLPQIAAFADAHFRVEKRKKDGRTVTRVVELDPEARVEELARMLGGAKVTRSARDHAEALLTQAGAPSAKSVATRGSEAPKRARKGSKKSRSAARRS
jgi:DNA repair protein RecN (Recombination protein N)